MAKLPEKQQRFVDEYLIDLNATRAAIRAGYSVKTAEQQGYKLVHKSSVLSEIKRRQAYLTKRTEVTQEKVIKELAKIAFADLKDYVKWDEDHVDILDSDDVDGAALLEVSETVNNQIFPNGGESEKRQKKVRLHDKTKALELLGKHLGMWVDKTEITGAQPVRIVDDLDD
ncbi:MAG: terminase small subunit [Sporolactobacillus sp.]